MNSPLPVEREALELARRIDWRFLLPSPRLGDVVVLGEADAALLAALGCFAGSYSRTSAPAEAEGHSYDLVVVVQPSRESLSRAAALSGPGAVLYIEVNRRRLPAGAWLRHPSWYKQRLERLGFTNIHAYWHWPDFARCKLISPLFEPAALTLAFQRSSDTVAGRLQALGGQSALAVGILPRLVPCFSLVAIYDDPGQP